MKVKKAIIVPNCNDYNRGDQALVWQAASLIRDVLGCDEIAIISSSSSSASNQQSIKHGLNVITGILKNPRRFKENEDYIKESKITILRLVGNSLIDFVHSYMLYVLARHKKICKKILSSEQYATYTEFLNTDLIVVKGGGFIHSYGEFRAVYYIWYQMYYLYLAKKLGKKVIILPNSFGPLKGPFIIRYLVKKILSKCEFVSARENISKQFMSDLLSKKVDCYPDMAYTLPGASKENGNVICNRYKIPVNEKVCVGLTLRPYRFSGNNNTNELYRKYICSFAELARHIDKNGMHPVFIAHVTGPNKHEDDRIALKKVINNLTTINYSYVDVVGDCLDIKDLYCCMDYLVGTRFHSVIFSQSEIVPSIAVSYGGNKGTGIMMDIGFQEYTIGIDKVNATEICKMFDNMINNSEIIKIRLKEWMQNVEQKKCDMYKAIKESLH
ncbi:polysaccharide pyruvyl transferase family protein [Chitinispirillales bacterium ANBcel5]|uniref:polysaccharide pyruvyl transferase family protein n=1 Tax=Cellulosispirillum alkaliphilum TaxID=3039283 RepID=UPI002A53D978|nr:polysaccharide pyruvyl transferase family protein [Chitinispirillales bacterium ANBcel5]